MAQHRFRGPSQGYIFNDPAELETIIKRAYDAGYTSEMVIQDFIPGDDSRMRVLNAMWTSIIACV